MSSAWDSTVLTHERPHQHQITAKPLHRGLCTEPNTVCACVQALPWGPPPPTADMYRNVIHDTQSSQSRGMLPPNLPGDAPLFSPPGRVPLHGGGRE